MKKKIMVIGLAVYFLFCCKGQTTKFKDDDFIRGFKACFNDKAFFVLGNFVKDNKYYVYSNYV